MTPILQCPMDPTAIGREGGKEGREREKREREKKDVGGGRDEVSRVTA